MRTLTLVQRFLSYMWNGPTGLHRSLQLEWRFVAVRWIGIACVTPGLLLVSLPAERLIAIFAVLAIAATYNVAIQLSIMRFPGLFTGGYLTVIGDGLLNAGFIAVAGGYDTPFYYVLFTVTISAAMRYGYGPALAMALIYVLFDGLEHVADARSIGGPFVFRSGFLCITAILAGYLREQAVKAEVALQERLRQASLLNEATATLGATLEFETVLESVVAAACRFLGCPRAVLVSSAALESDGIGARPAVRCPATDRSDVDAELEELCRRHAADTAWLNRKDRFAHIETLPSGRRAVVLVLALATRQISLATLALALPEGQKAPALDPDHLDSFVERITLAIENSSLYRTLAIRSNTLQRTYADLARAHEELLSLDQMKTNFLANVSHELRTPLNSIRAFSELLLTYDDDPTVQKEFLGIINSESERLTRLINDVLDLVKIESGHMDWHMSMIDLRALLEDSTRPYVALIEKNGLQLEQDIQADLPSVFGDRDRLYQVVSNLLSNALKFTEQGSIKLAARRIGGEIHVSISDTGVGIPAEEHERIFDKFQQVGDTLTDKPRGTGLGLAICRDLVTHHGGRIWTESERGKGSTFTFTLPVTEGAERGHDHAMQTAQAVA